MFDSIEKNLLEIEDASATNPINPRQHSRPPNQSYRKSKHKKMDFYHGKIDEQVRIVHPSFK